jgi:hypothetical protein
MAGGGGVCGVKGEGNEVISNFVQNKYPSLFSPSRACCATSTLPIRFQNKEQNSGGQSQHSEEGRCGGKEGGRRQGRHGGETRGRRQGTFLEIHTTPTPQRPRLHASPSWFSGETIDVCTCVQWMRDLLDGARAVAVPLRPLRPTPPTPPLPHTSSLLQRVCQLCQLALSIRSPKKQLMEHVDAKHSKQGYEACFPGGPTE